MLDRVDTDLLGVGTRRRTVEHRRKPNVAYDTRDFLALGIFAVIIVATLLALAV